MAASQPGPRYSGWWRNPATAALEIRFAGAKVGSVTGAGLALTGAFTATTSFAATTTVTGGTGVIATTGDVDTTTGNFRAGVKSAFVTTEPTSALVMKAGTAFAGAITTSGGIQASATVVRKIIADGTVSNVET